MKKSIVAGGTTMTFLRLSQNYLQTKRRSIFAGSKSLGSAADRPGVKSILRLPRLYGLKARYSTLTRSTHYYRKNTNALDRTASLVPPEATYGFISPICRTLLWMRCTKNITQDVLASRLVRRRKTTKFHFS